MHALLFLFFMLFCIDRYFKWRKKRKKRFLVLLLINKFYKKTKMKQYFIKTTVILAVAISVLAGVFTLA